jgi:hypothetical protein
MQLSQCHGYSCQRRYIFKPRQKQIDNERGASTNMHSVHQEASSTATLRPRHSSNRTKTRRPGPNLFVSHPDITVSSQRAWEKMTYRRSCAYCKDSTAGHSRGDCGASYYDNAYLDSLFSHFRLYSVTPDAMEDVRRLAKDLRDDVQQWVVRNGVVSLCGKPKESEQWPTRLYGLSYVLQRFFSSPCARKIGDIEFFTTLGDGPVQRFDKEDWWMESRPHSRNRLNGSSALPFFSLVTIRSHYLDIPLPWHDALQTARENVQLLLQPIYRRWRQKEPLVESHRGPNTWDPQFRHALEDLYGKHWPFSHRVSMCLYPQESWTFFGFNAQGRRHITEWTPEIQRVSKRCPAERFTAAAFDYAQHARFRYQLYLDGATSSFFDAALRVAGLMLLPETPFKMWHTDQFHPMVHHVPIARDLSDLEEWYQRLEANQTQASEIFEHGLRRIGIIYQWSAVSCYLCGVFQRYSHLFARSPRSSRVGGKGCTPHRLCKAGEIPPTSHDQSFSSTDGWKAKAPLRCL